MKMQVYKFICPFHGLQLGIPCKVERDVEIYDKKFNKTIKTTKSFDGVRCPGEKCEVKRTLQECEVVEEKEDGGE